MNPNSGNQWWSRWTFVVRLPYRASHHTQVFRLELHSAAARLFRQLFGSAGQARVDVQCLVTGAGLVEEWRFEARVEGAPAHDPAFRRRRCLAVTQWLERGFGPGAHVTSEAVLEAGSPQDGRPSAQLVMLPSLAAPRVAVR